MDSLQFKVWLHGYYELSAFDEEEVYLDSAQLKCVRDHMKLVAEESCYDNFMRWLEGYLDCFDEMIDKEFMDYIRASRKIESELDKNFIKKTPDYKHLIPFAKSPTIHPHIPRPDEKWPLPSFDLLKKTCSNDLDGGGSSIKFCAKND